MALAAVLVLALLAGSARYSQAGSSWNTAGAVIGGFGLGMAFGHALSYPHYVVVAPPPPPPPPVYYYPYPYPAYPYYYGYPRVYYRHYGHHRHYGRW